MGSHTIPNLTIFLILCFFIIFLPCCFSENPSDTQKNTDENKNNNVKEEIDDAGEIIEVKSGPSDVVWVVQLSDLHFSVHHPERAHDFKAIVGPTLSMINPSLVFVTGDLTGILSAFFLAKFMFIASIIIFLIAIDGV